MRVLEVSVRGGVAVIDLATDGTPSGLEVLDRLVRAELGEAAGVDIRAVPLATLTPALRTQEPPVVDCRSGVRGDTHGKGQPVARIAPAGDL